MKLTNSIRSAFINAVMDDVPEIDYEEQIRTLVFTTVVAGMPAKLRAVWDDEKLRDSVATEYIYITDCISVVVPIYPGCEDVAETTAAETEKLHALHHLQHEKRNELRRKLYGVAHSKTTTKGLIEALPQFEKYLPKEGQVTQNLPALTNVLEDFIAAGWKQPEGAAA